MKKYTIGKSEEEVKAMLPDRKPVLTQVGEQKICLLRTGNDYFGFEPYCPHRGAALNGGWPNAEGEIVCPLHNYRFDLQTGQAQMGGCNDLKVFKVQLSEHGLMIEIP